MPWLATKICLKAMSVAAIIDEVCLWCRDHGIETPAIGQVERLACSARRRSAIRRSLRLWSANIWLAVPTNSEPCVPAFLLPRSLSTHAAEVIESTPAEQYALVCHRGSGMAQTSAGRGRRATPLSIEGVVPAR